MTTRAKYGDRVSVTVTGTVIKDYPSTPSAALLIRLDPEHGGDAVWYSPTSCTILVASDSPSNPTEKT